jgi:hypothetical protein
VSSNLINLPAYFNIALTAAERLSDRRRWRDLPWAARKIARRHGLRPMMAKAIAENIGLPMEAR